MCAAVPAIGSWKTRATYRATLWSGRRSTRRPSIFTVPPSGRYRPETTFSRVDLLAPFEPMTVQKSPAARCRVTPDRATFSLTVPGKKAL